MANNNVLFLLCDVGTVFPCFAGDFVVLEAPLYLPDTYIN